MDDVGIVEFSALLAPFVLSVEFLELLVINDGDGFAGMLDSLDHVLETFLFVALPAELAVHQAEDLLALLLVGESKQLLDARGYLYENFWNLDSSRQALDLFYLDCL